MGTAATRTRQNRTITVDFHDETTYYHLLGDGKAFLEWLMLRFRVLFDQPLNQRLKQGFAPLPNIMDKLEETKIAREFLL